ncbi:hypothetical protein TIFTF001_017959 [Ficus carica]|uniref:Uncharacterized protein n=1 Tax=Ficus carica TaxID=3494 RepID=A0AA88D8T9_FICCA|nr:hypothetical protein TIFTF001_017959 [Ficus carica]
MHLPSIVLHVYNLRHSSAESEIGDQLTVGVEILEFRSSISTSMRFFDKEEQKGIEDKVETLGRWDGDGVSREAAVTE